MRGDGRISENSDTRVKIGDCVGGSATMVLVPAFKLRPAVTRDWDVMS